MTYALIIDIIGKIGGAAWTKETEEDRMEQEGQTEQEDRTEREDQMEQEDRTAQENRIDRMYPEQEEIQQIENAVKKADGSSPEVLYLRTSASSVTAKGSEGNVCGEILSDLGCINIADGNAALSESLSLEAILQADPDYIFVTPQGTDKEAAIANIDHLFTSNPAWQSLSAVKNGNYYVLDPYLYNLKPNERWGEAYEKMADILYEK